MELEFMPQIITLLHQSNGLSAGQKRLATTYVINVALRFAF